MKLYNFIFANENLEKQLSGNNFSYKIQKYEKLTKDNLPKYVVNFSEFNKWGINPQAKWFPKGIYFYFLHPKCREYGATGRGFGSERKWANIAELNLDKFVILYSENPKHFNEKNFQIAIEKLKNSFSNYKFRIEGNNDFASMFRLIIEMERDGLGSFNKILHIAGYDGILDIDGSLLPIESCQGVQTWPEAANYIESIQTPASINRTTPRSIEKIKNIQKRFRNIPNGSLNITDNEFSKLLNNFKIILPKENSDNKDHIKDFISSLFQKINLNQHDLNSNSAVANYVEKYGEEMFSSFENNPTTPKSFWNNLLHSRFEDVRMAAKNLLNNQ